ncbi:class I SAM-dependent methyltransferase [Pyrococcus kukulkanii]|uniref:Class I SAM-dependent methyltransferase n=1 Tax=Pyrococcus kukulkanii TaxID=1609559 RepID=A0ABV4T4P2_9EURY
MEWKDCKHSREAGKYYSLNQETFLNFLRKHKIRAKRVLDIGCGGGELTLKIAEAVGAEEVYGVHINDKAIKAASSKGIEVVKYNIENGLPFEDNFFDLITANQVFEHINNTKLLFSETFRILKIRDML